MANFGIPGDGPLADSAVGDGPPQGSTGILISFTHPDWVNQQNIKARQRFVIQYRRQHKPWRHPAPRRGFWASINFAPARISWSGLEVPNAGAPTVRVTWSGLEAISSGAPAVRTSWFGIEVASAIPSAIPPAQPAPLNRYRVQWRRAAFRKKKALRRRHVYAPVVTVVLPPVLTFSGSLARWRKLAFRRQHKPHRKRAFPSPVGPNLVPMRVTWSGLEVGNAGAPAVRITWSALEVSNPGAPTIRITWSGLEIPNPGAPKARVTMFGLEVASSLAVAPPPRNLMLFVIT